VNPHTASIEELMAAAKRRAVVVPEKFGGDRDHWLNLLLAECVEPKLGFEAPAILYDYPASQAALAKIRQESPPVAERFELYIRGIELANGYQELVDPQTLCKRNSAANAARVADGKPSLPENSRLIAAMEAGLADCSGVALGFDRLVMIAAGAKSLAEVMAFPVDRA
jgi:lysyl-tRNA synthetase class 2